MPIRGWRSVKESQIYGFNDCMKNGSSRTADGNPDVWPDRPRGSVNYIQGRSTAASKQAELRVQHLQLKAGMEDFWVIFYQDY